MTKAAELHHISPPAFSKAIKILESELGQPLTLPHGRGLLLTDYALSLVPSLQEIIQRIDSIKSHVSLEPERNRKKIRIATFEVFSTYFMEKALTAFSDYECSLLELIPGKMEEAVASHKADLALTYLPIPHLGLDFLKVQEIEMGLYGNEKGLSKINYSELPFVVPIEPIQGSPNKVVGLDGWPDDAFPRKIIYKVDMLESALGLCRRGLAIAYIPKFLVKCHNEIVRPEFQLKEIPLPTGFPKRKDFVYLIKRKTDIEGIEAKKIAACIRKICN